MLCARASRSIVEPREFQEAVADFHDWDSFLESSIKNGLACFVYQGISHSDVRELFPDHVKEKLATLQRENFARNAIIFDELTTIVHECNRHGFQPIVIGSIPLFHSVFKDISVRPLQDIDLLVEEAQLAILQDFLPKLGFENVRPYPNLFRKDTIYVDLHTEPTEAKRIKSVRGAFYLPFGELRKDARPLPLPDADHPSASARALSFEDALILASLHNLKHCYYKLTWTFDAFCMTAVPLHWKRILEKSRKFHTSYPVFATLYLAHELFHAEIPRDVMRSLLEEKVPAPAMLVLDAAAKGMSGRWGELLTFLLARDLAGAIRFAFELLFPSRQVMREIFELTGKDVPAPILCFYYARRFLKAARESLKSGIALLKSHLFTTEKQRRGGGRIRRHP